MLPDLQKAQGTLASEDWQKMLESLLALSRELTAVISRVKKEQPAKAAAYR